MEMTASLVSAPLQPLAGATAVAPPSAAATQQFAALMQAPAEAAALPATPAAARVTGPASVGDKILNGMQSMSDEFRGILTREPDTLRPDGPSLGLHDILSAQLHMSQALLGLDLLTKAAHTVPDVVNQTVRVQ